MTDQMCRKWFVKFLGTVDILAKQFFTVGVSYALKQVQQHPGLDHQKPIEVDGQHTQNIQINKVVCKNENNVSFIFTMWTFWTTQYFEK